MDEKTADNKLQSCVSLGDSITDLLDVEAQLRDTMDQVILKCHQQFMHPEYAKAQGLFEGEYQL